MTRRWPLHPQPGPLEALSSWLARIAALYHLPVADLLTGNLDLVGMTVPDDLDHDPPAAMLAALADRTGVDLARIRAMTLAGWRPWLLDTIDGQDTQAAFDNYVRASSVLLAPRAKGSAYRMERHPTWRGPWLPRHRHSRTCPICATMPDRGRELTGRLPLMVSCGEHGCRLQDAAAVDIETTLHGRPPAPVPVAEPVAALDRYTHQALITGRVGLPGRSVHAGVWFRLLRGLLHEVSLPLTAAGVIGGRALDLIWRTAGHPVRAGLGTWQPYEQLPWPTQEKMLHAAAVALHLAADGRLTARGVHGGAVQPTPPRRVYDGDPPSPNRTVWTEVAVTAQEMLELARTDSGAARHLLALITMGRRTREANEQGIALLRRHGVPAGFLPADYDLDRLFPIGAPQRQPAASAGRR